MVGFGFPLYLAFLICYSFSIASALYNAQCSFDEKSTVLKLIRQKIINSSYIIEAQQLMISLY